MLMTIGSIWVVHVVVVAPAELFFEEKKYCFASTDKTHKYIYNFKSNYIINGLATNTFILYFKSVFEVV